jgi:uncharacterized membrane protein YdjX (TVP38/TMEM64 family)
MPKKSVGRDQDPLSIAPLGPSGAAAIEPRPIDAAHLDRALGQGQRPRIRATLFRPTLFQSAPLHDRQGRPKGRAWVVWSVRLFGVVTIGALAAWLWTAYDWADYNFWDWTSDVDPWVFFVLLAVLPAVGFPTSPFYLLAGATFGTGVALVGSGLSMALYLVLSWWIAHTGMRPWIESRLARTSFKMPKLTSPAQAIRFALLVKIAPGVPATLKTYLLCLSGITFPVYFWVSFIVSLIYAAIFILLGESVLEHDFGRLGWVLLAFVLVGGLIWWTRRRLGAQKAV